MHATHIIYDRYLAAISAVELAPHAPLRVPQTAQIETFETPYALLQETWTDGWNAAVFAEIFHLLGRPVERVSVPVGSDRVARTSGSSLRMRLSPLRALLSRLLLGFCASRHPRLLFSAAYHFTLKDVSRLRFAVDGLKGVRRVEWSPLRPGLVDEVAREELSELGGETRFERVFVRLLPRLIPRSLIEEYPAVCDASQRLLGSSPLHCVVDGLSDPSPPLCEFIGRSADAGKNIVTVQHGGGYGTFATRSVERLDIGLAGQFWSWGWVDADGARSIHPMPSPHLSRLRDTWRGGTWISLIGCGFPRYAYRLMSCPISDQFARQRALFAAYVGAVSPALRARMRFKPYPRDYGWGPLPKELGMLPTDVPGRARAWEWIRSSHLAVVGYPDTTFVESLVLDAPTIGIWDDELWEIRPSAREAFDRLKEVGVVYHDAVSAAARTEELYGAASAWWQSDDVQIARLHFIESFGLNRPDWKSCWIERVSQLTSEKP